MPRLVYVEASHPSLQYVTSILNDPHIPTTRAVTPPYPPLIKADAPIAYWRLDDTGAVALDATGGGRNGALNGTITKGVAGALTDGDAAMGFDGSTGYVSVGGSGLGVAGPLSVELWINAVALNNGSGGGFPTMLEKQNASGDNYRMFGNSSDASLQFRVSGLNTDARTAASVIPLGSWIHVVGIYGAAAGQLIIYVNGIQSVAQAVTGTPAAVNNNPLNIGQSAALGSRFFQGSIDEVAIYNYALSAGQVLNHYNAGIATLTVPATYILSNTSDGSWQGVDGATDQDLQVYVGGLASGGFPAYNGYTDGSGNGKNPNGVLGG